MYFKGPEFGAVEWPRRFDSPREKFVIPSAAHTAGDGMTDFTDDRSKCSSSRHVGLAQFTNFDLSRAEFVFTLAVQERPGSELCRAG